MSVHKYKDWASWWDGLRSVMMRTGATAIATQLTAMLGTNGVAHLHIPGLDDIGLNWKTALAQLVIQFVIHTGIAAANYVQNKPDPDVIVETVETTFIKKGPDETISQGSKITTTTPVTPPEQPKE